MPSDQAIPELVVASAWNPRPSSSRALPASHGFGITKQPDSCSFRNVSATLDLLEELDVHRAKPEPLRSPAPQRVEAWQESFRLGAIGKLEMDDDVAFDAVDAVCHHAARGPAQGGGVERAFP